jgi:hypothetical protein
MPGHGPASAITGNPSDNRRVIRVVINNLGNPNDPTSWFNPTTNSVDPAILAAAEEAANRWNNATDQAGNKTGYFFHVTASQSAQDLEGADIIVSKQDPGVQGACMGIQVFRAGMTQITMPPSAVARQLQGQH